MSVKWWVPSEHCYFSLVTKSNCSQYSSPATLWKIASTHMEHICKCIQNIAIGNFFTLSFMHHLFRRPNFDITLGDVSVCLESKEKDRETADTHPLLLSHAHLQLAQTIKTSRKLGFFSFITITLFYIFLQRFYCVDEDDASSLKFQMSLSRWSNISNTFSWQK